MTRRRLPRWSEVMPLVRVRRPAFGSLQRRLAGAVTIMDLRTLARRRTPRAVFDYVDGAAESEISIRRSRDAFERVEFYPRALRDVTSVDTSTTLLGSPSRFPLVFAPTGFTRLMHHEGEAAVARVAERLEIPYALSTLGTTSPEGLAAAAPACLRWFQLYVRRDRELSTELLDRARAGGYAALVLTVDTPVAGARHRDARNGLSIPPALTIGTIADMASHPRWWLNLLTTEPLTFASLSTSDGTVAELVDRLFDPSVSMADLEWLRGAWSGPLAVKGIQTPEDARAVVDLGADGVIVSNHGGRQLDRSPTPLEQLPRIVEVVEDRAEVYLDGGITTGGDIVAAVAMNARGALVGRAYLYGLMAGGERGVDRAGQILVEEMVRTMRLLGARSLGELSPRCVSIRNQHAYPEMHD